MNLRPATPTELEALNAIAFAAKAHWGYTAEQLEVWRQDLLVSGQSLSARPVCVAELGGQAIGFAQVATDVQPWELWALWVHPAHMGQGAGTALLAWARKLAAAAGQPELAIESDPHAEPFYRARGARWVGAVRAPISGQPSWVRPQLRLSSSAG